MPNPFNTPEPYSVAGFPLYKMGCLKKREITALGLEPGAEMNRLLQVYELAFEISQQENMDENDALNLVLNFGAGFDSGNNNVGKLIKYITKIQAIYSSIKTNATKAEVLIASRLNPDWLYRNFKFVSESFCFELDDSLLELLKESKKLPLEIAQLLIEELPEDIINELAAFVDKEASRWAEPEQEAGQKDSQKKPSLSGFGNSEKSQQDSKKTKSTGTKSTPKSSVVESQTRDSTPTILTSVG